MRVRILSWFNKDTICMDCSAIEDRIKKALRLAGEAGAREGCGYVPTVYIIRSLDERDDETNEALYWSNEFGWVPAGQADLFSDKEQKRLNLPIKGRWEVFKRGIHHGEAA